MPPHVAIATNKFGATGLSIGAIVKFWKNKKILWKYAIPFSVLAIVGGLTGAKFLLEINEDILLRVVGIVLLLFLPIMYFNKDIGTLQRKTSNLKKIIGTILYFLLLVFGGFFGGGAGMLIFICLMYFFGFTIIESNATDIVPWFFVSLSSLIYFSLNGMVELYIGIALFIGMLIGGYFGAHIAIKKGNKWVKTIFAIIVVVASIKILFF